MKINKKTLGFAFVLLIALTVRIFYSYDLPVHHDEAIKLDLAGRCSLAPDTFNIPLGSNLTNHPMFTVYLIALAKWVGRESVFIIRVVFTLLSMLGLTGLFFLTKRLFGYRAAICAAILASIDRYLAVNSTWFVETCYIFIVPWIILKIFECVDTDKKRDWLLLGLLLGIGYNFNPLIILLLLPALLYIPIYRRSRPSSIIPRLLMVVIPFLILILPHLLWNIRNSSPNIQYIFERGLRYGLGLSPRFLLLFIGDLLIPVKDSVWIVLSGGHQVYSPRYLPCNYIAGILYLLSVIFAFRHRKDKRFSLLLLSVITVAIPISIIYPVESWNNFWYGNAALFPMIAITGYFSSRLLSTIRGRVLVASLLAYLILSIAFFLAGPKWYYPALSWEKSYIGKMDFFLNTKRFKNRGFPEAREITEITIAKHPESSIAHYYKGRLAFNKNDMSSAFNESLRIDPGNTLVYLFQLDNLIKKRLWSEAGDKLDHILATGKDEYYQIYSKFARVKDGLGDYEKAEEYLVRAIKLKPDKFDLYEILFFIRDKMGKEALAKEALDIFAQRYFEDPYNAYIRVAAQFSLSGKFRKAGIYAEKAEELLLRYTNKNIGRLLRIAEPITRLGNIYLSIGKNDEAIEVLKKAIELDPNHAEAYFNIAAAYYKKSEYREASSYCATALKLGHPLTPALIEIMQGPSSATEQEDR